jgi:hypothetical protein
MKGYNEKHPRPANWSSGRIVSWTKKHGRRGEAVLVLPEAAEITFTLENGN